MVLSKKNYNLLESLKVETIFGHPQYEQGFLNVKRKLLNIKLHSLPSCFNYIPLFPFFSSDWRQSFFFHCASAGKKEYRYGEIWEDISNDRKTFSKIRFMVSFIRVNLIRQTLAQMDGKEVYIFDPTDFYYLNALAFPIFDKNEGVLTFFPAWSGDGNPLAVFGPYISLKRGRWRAEFKKFDDTNFLYKGALIDIVYNSGSHSAMNLIEWPENGVIEFDIIEDSINVEIRIFRTTETAEFSCLRIERFENI